jgi:DNA-binding CsgD family transcriptional regulator
MASNKPPNQLDNIIVSHYRITPREHEVIVLLNKGLSTREMAEILFVSPATVKTHLHNIYEKTGVKSRYELFHRLSA